MAPGIETTQLKTFKHFKITQSTLSQSIQEYKKLNNYLLKNRGSVEQLWPAKFPELEKALVSWTMEAHTHQIAVNDAILREKVVQLGHLLDAQMNFSDRWVNNFKKWFNVQSLVLHGEAAYASKISAEVALKELQEITKEYALQDIYNAQKTGLTYK